MATKEVIPGAPPAGSPTPTQNTSANSRKVCASSAAEEFARRLEDISYEAPAFTTAEELVTAYDKAVEGARRAATARWTCGK